MADAARMSALRSAVEKKPEADFPRYGLAMELVSAEEFGEAEEHFLKLLEHHPDQISGHFMLGKLYGRLDRCDEARETLEKGIAIAEKKGDTHAADEMRDEIETLE